MLSQNTKEKIVQKMKTMLSATSVEVIDDSQKHVGHAQAGGGGHFTVLLVSEKFDGVSLLDRNRMVFDALKEEMKSEIHALAVKAKTPAEAAGSPLF